MGARVAGSSAAKAPGGGARPGGATEMKIGLGLYRHMLTEDNVRFARQAGATHIVAHLVDYFDEGPRIPDSISARSGWGVTRRVGKPWTLDEIAGVKTLVEREG